MRHAFSSQYRPKYTGSTAGELLTRRIDSEPNRPHQRTRGQRVKRRVDRFFHRQLSASISDKFTTRQGMRLPTTTTTAATKKPSSRRFREIFIRHGGTGANNGRRGVPSVRSPVPYLAGFTFRTGFTSSAADEVFRMLLLINWHRKVSTMKRNGDKMTSFIALAL